MNVQNVRLEFGLFVGVFSVNSSFDLAGLLQELWGEEYQLVPEFQDVISI